MNRNHCNSPSLVNAASPGVLTIFNGWYLKRGAEAGLLHERAKATIISNFARLYDFDELCPNLEMANTFSRQVKEETSAFGGSRKSHPARHPSLDTIMDACHIQSA